MEEPHSCVRHDEIQGRLQQVRDLVNKHQQIVLTKKQNEENKEWIQKFVKGGKKGHSIWGQIKQFHTKPSVFKFKELQINVEADVKRKFPDITEKEIQEKVKDICNNIEQQVKEEFMQKYPNSSKGEIGKKLRELNVKGFLTGDMEKYLGDKAEYLVEEPISQIMFNKPGLLRRGLNLEKKSYQHLSNILGQITPNCFDENCSHTSECYQMEADLILIYPSEEKIILILNEVKKIRGKDVQTSLERLVTGKELSSRFFFVRIQN